VDVATHLAATGGWLIAGICIDHHRQFGQRHRLVILWFAMDADDSLPDDVTALKAMLRAGRAARLAAEAKAQARTLLIEKRKLTIKCLS
jgi:transposase